MAFKKGFYLLLFAVWFGCSVQEEDISTSSSLRLTFSNDTVLFDTLLTARSSITKRLRIFNPNENAIEVQSIRLGKGNQSSYSLIVNGKSGGNIEGEVIFGGDSILLLVEVTIDPQNEDLPYIVKDSIIVDWNGNSAHVKLVSWGQDANYLNQATIKTEVWSRDRPYVIRDFLIVDSLETLTLQAGTRVLMDVNSNIFVQGSLHIEGDTADKVIVRNTRFDPNYLQAPGQWGGIYFLEGSENNQINHAIIENGVFGLRVGNPDPEDDFDLLLTNVSIRHMSDAGILAFTSDIDAYNVEVYNCATYLVGNFAGGNYRYRHCTFNNQPSFFINNDPMVQFSDNVLISEDEAIVAGLSLLIENSIIWGSTDNQLIINNGGGADLNLTLSKNLIRSSEAIADNFTSTDPSFPGFQDPLNFDYRLDSLSFARDKALGSDILLDISGKERGNTPDLGAHEFVPNL